MSTISRRGRSRVAVFAVVAVLASLLALPLPAGAATAACPDTIPSAGFTDMAGYSAAAQDAVDCIAAYGVTAGNNAAGTTYGPADSVPRWQMAIFLWKVLAAGGATIDTTDAGFTDLTGVGSTAVGAINAIANAGVTAGKGSATTFAPFDIVNRREMAIFIAATLTELGVTLDEATDFGFTDLAGVTDFAKGKINGVANAGIAAGTVPGAKVFSPEMATTRVQMAFFLTQTLDEAGLVYSGLSLSADKYTTTTTGTIKLTVTITDGGAPVEAQRVDLFVASSFNTDGTEVGDTDAALNGGDWGTSTNGVIDAGDPQTDANGEIKINLTHANVAEADTVVAWVGDLGDDFDKDKVAAADMVEITVTWTLGADDFSAKVDGGAAGGAPFGTSETVSLQALNGTTKVKVAGEDYQITATRAGVAGILAQTAVTSDADGVASFTWTGPADPTANVDDASIKDTLTIVWDKDGDGKFEAGEPSKVVTVDWDDDKSAPASVTLKQAAYSSLENTSKTVTATVVDQYGDPQVGFDVQFSLSVVGTTPVRTTDGSGVATLTYTGPGTTNGAKEMIGATVDGNDDGDFGDGAVIDDVATPVTHYWLELAGDVAGSVEWDILNAASGVLHVANTAGTAFYQVAYDSNDQFAVGGVAKTMAQFETAVDDLTLPDLDGVGLTGVFTNPYDDTSSNVSVWNLIP